MKTLLETDLADPLQFFRKDTDFRKTHTAITDNIGDI